MSPAELDRQAEAFAEWHRRVGGPIDAAFATWSRSKDLLRRDREGIWWRVLGLMKAAESGPAEASAERRQETKTRPAHRPAGRRAKRFNHFA